MAITSRDQKGNTVLLAGERQILRRAFREVKSLIASRAARAPVNMEWAQIIAHTWELLHDADEAPERIGGHDELGRRGYLVRKPLSVVRNADDSTIVVDKDRSCLRAFYSASYSFLAKEKIAVTDESARRCLCDAWDIVRNDDDPALPFRTNAEAALMIPFSALLPAAAAPSRGFH